MSDKFDKVYLQVKNGFESSVIRSIMFSLIDCNKKLDLNNLVDLLYGTSSNFIIRNGLDHLRMFSALSLLSKRDIKKIIISMWKNKLLKSNGSHFKYTFEISKKGHEYWKNPDDTLNIFEDINNTDLVVDLPVNEALLYRSLKTYRSSIANDEDIPAYKFCRDSSLEEICIRKPRDLSALINIKGIGVRFIEKYGIGFQKILNEFYEKNNI